MDCCSICLENIEGEFNRVVTECKHVFHCSCLTKHILMAKNRGVCCPNCRNNMEQKETAEQADERRQTEEYHRFQQQEILRHQMEERRRQMEERRRQREESERIIEYEESRRIIEVRRRAEARIVEERRLQQENEARINENRRLSRLQRENEARIVEKVVEDVVTKLSGRFPSRLEFNNSLNEVENVVLQSEHLPQRKEMRMVIRWSNRQMSCVPTELQNDLKVARKNATKNNRLMKKLMDKIENDLYSNLERLERNRLFPLGFVGFGFVAPKEPSHPLFV